MYCFQNSNDTEDPQREIDKERESDYVLNARQQWLCMVCFVGLTTHQPWFLILDSFRACYGILSEDAVILITNASGVIMGIVYSAIFYQYTPNKPQMTKYVQTSFIGM